MEITTIGLDLAKTVFQVHAINSASEVVVKKTLRRVKQNCSKAYWAPLRGSMPREYQIAKVPGWVA